MDIYQQRAMPKRKNILLEISRIIILTAGVGLSLYFTLTGHFELMSTIFFVAGAFMFGFFDPEMSQKKQIITTILAALFIFISSICTFLD
ncbi:hypothetical protein [Lentibacillus jeotgali]|uniref:hypothetical protein n=1 Tax=Lentibacillus jeotgali TaxID=558169 RepID=UPI0002627839|nr:hypothetical protein [Lentibacillus jeotgali]